MSTRVAAGYVIALFLAGCAVAVPFKAYEGPDLAPSELALIVTTRAYLTADDPYSGADFGAIISVTQGEVLFYSSDRDFPPGLSNDLMVFLRPGTYSVTYQGQCPRQRSTERIDAIAIQPGHKYVVKRAGCFIFNPNSQGLRLWIEDSDTGTDVSGSKGERISGYGIIP